MLIMLGKKNCFPFLTNIIIVSNNINLILVLCFIHIKLRSKYNEYAVCCIFIVPNNITTLFPLKSLKILNFKIAILFYVALYMLNL